MNISEIDSFFKGAFKDKRIDKRANKLLSSIVENSSVVINKACSTFSEKIGGYRMLNNERANETDIKDRVYKKCAEQISTDHVLCIEDTSEINYSGKEGRINTDDSEWGIVGNNKDTGVFCHPTLVVDAHSGIPLGFSSIKLWNRQRDKEDKNERNYKILKIQDKESYRWIESAELSKQNIPESTKITVIADRESDIYEFLATVPNDRCDVLIRSSANRILETEEMRLHEKMCSLPIKHIYNIKVQGNHKRKNREAKMELRYDSVEIKCPHNLKADQPKSLTVSCVYVVENSETVPKGESPIEWRLLTTHEVESNEIAMLCVEWYKQRWYIEEVFRLIKSEGLKIESTQLESGAALKKLIIFALLGAWQIMMVKLSYDKSDISVPAKRVFTDPQIEFLQILLKTVEGKTEKQKNPFDKDTLAWTSWIIALLAGWSGYKSQGPPGYITIRDGIQCFNAKYQVFELLRDVYKE
ncbi:IS4 family transposase [Myroides odoratimimus]|uniref:IS4 family transposase n=1 Tax=Myroides odoratimimus TaxID=76832 RepID=UPI002577299C|nr:IS4 family transposase [Myroides odoratimimus]MDM1066941.1 IS4 family transposase [Myroides odoratimimus]